MSVEIIRNSRAGSEGSPESPVHDDGSRFPFAMYFDGGKFIAYADSPTDLMDALIPGYAEMAVEDQEVQRIKYAVRAQVAAQAMINAETDPQVWDSLSEVEQGVLNGPRFEQPHGWSEDDEFGDVWSSKVVLVLVETGYAPYTDRAKPVSGIADVLNPPNIAWLRPADEWEFLQSLAQIEQIQLFEATDL